MISRTYSQIDRSNCSLLLSADCNKFNYWDADNDDHNHIIHGKSLNTNLGLGIFSQIYGLLKIYSFTGIPFLVNYWLFFLN